MRWHNFFIAACALHRAAAATSNQGVSVSIDLKSYLNNKGVSASPGGANFDGNSGSYPLDQLPNPKAVFVHRGINFTFPAWGTASVDNIVSQGQNISLTTGRYQSLHLIAAGDGGSIYTNNITVSYDDGTTVTQALLVPGWKDSHGIINLNRTFTSNGIDGNSSRIHYFQVPLNAGKALRSVTLPTGKVGSSRFHVFAMSLFTAPSLSSPGGAGPALTFQYVRSRNQWYNDSAQVSSLDTTALSFMKILDASAASQSVVQVVEVAVANLPFAFNSKSWFTGKHTVEISSQDLKTVYAGTLNRLRPGDQARVKVGVVNARGAVRGKLTHASAIVKDARGAVVATSPTFEVTAGIPEYDSTPESLGQHEAPQWFEDSKLGIFVHWGVYSVPAFSPTGIQYAEWYWWQLHEPNNTDSPTWVHHKETYGEEFLYDDFIPMFNPTAANWSADSFTDLFAESGAKYFTIVSSHHGKGIVYPSCALYADDAYYVVVIQQTASIAMFDTGNTSHRNTVVMGPKRDFLKEIFDSAAKRHPELVAATYYSTPQWYNPAYQKYGIENWPGGLAHNAYNWSETEPYTGFVEVDDYIQDIQTPQIEILLNTYETNVLWCDIGGTTNVTEIIPAWYNRKYAEGKNVAIDDRCGTYLFDFSTPEYTTYGVVHQDKWESNSGLDPHSYGYNAQTPFENYMNITTAIHMIADIVSKNGNWLVDIGPTGNGSVVAPEVTTLRGLGAWLKKAGKSIYATDYWFIGPQESANLRFTTTPLAFYITTISNPSPSFEVRSPVPVLANDTITLLGGSGKPLKFSIAGDGGVLTINVPPEEASLVSDAWAFEIVY